MQDDSTTHPISLNLYYSHVNAKVFQMIVPFRLIDHNLCNYYKPSPTHPPWFHYSDYTWRRARNYEILQLSRIWYILEHFTFMWPCIVTNFFVIKPTRCTNFTNLFCHETLHAFEQDQVLLESCLQTCMTYTIAECQWINTWWWTEEPSEICRVSCQNKFVKLALLVGFIIKKYFTMHGHMKVKKLLAM